MMTDGLTHITYPLIYSQYTFISKTGRSSKPSEVCCPEILLWCPQKIFFKVCNKII